MNKIQTARTPTAEEVEAAAKAMYEQDPAYMDSNGYHKWTWDLCGPNNKDYWRKKASAALTAALNQ